MIFKTLKQVKRVFTILAGFTVVVVGLILAIPGVPGPGFLVILAGLAILAAEFVWARRLLDRLKAHGTRIRDTVLSRTDSKKRNNSDTKQA